MFSKCAIPSALCFVLIELTRPVVVYLIPAFLSVVTGTLLPRSADAPAGLSSVRSLDARAVAPTLDFHNSTWIWTGEKPMPLGVRPFRKTIPASKTKCPVCATILISSDDTYSIVVNGAEIGSGNGWGQPAVYTAALQPENENVFAIAMNNLYVNAASLIVTIHVDYKDGTSETIVTDNTWKTLKTVPPSGWANPNFNDSAWGNAVSILAGTSTPWGQPFVLPPVMNMTGRREIWTNESNAQGTAPVGHRPFRKTITSPYGKAAVCGKVVITADNAYTLYVNGDNIGSGRAWRSMQAYSIPRLDSDVNDVVVDGENVTPNSRAWVAAGILIAYNDGSSERYYTDASWKTLNSAPSAGFEQAGTDDSSWMSATDLGPFSESGETVPRA
ncbi:lectin [Desarmillaria tabescens]|uniref:Lectin n=1 Tax=Armillaria tabescens TaxID=1929756 RepID=A0AA39KHW0_ARMTA|nr:lectin [Desarmillaria tabescens]KAK0460149.1 lectin [Desarmillaria tabescens]